MEKLYSQQKQDQELTPGSDHELLIAKFRLKLKKVGKTTRPFSSVQFSRSVMSDSLWPHELQHTRLPCPSPTPGVYPNSCHYLFIQTDTPSQVALVVKNLPSNAGDIRDVDTIPGMGRPP